MRKKPSYIGITCKPPNLEQKLNKKGLQCQNAYKFHYLCMRNLIARVGITQWLEQKTKS